MPLLRTCSVSGANGRKGKKMSEEKVPGPFDVVNAIASGNREFKQNEGFAKAYVPFIINRQFSYFTDTVLIANQLNEMAHLDKDLQWEFAINTIKPKKRFAKWAKREVLQDIDMVKRYYNYNDAKARSALSRLTKEQLDHIRQWYAEVSNE
jgi:hypothetical protein